MINPDLAQHNLKLIEKSVWIAAFGFCSLIALIGSYEQAGFAILIGILMGLIFGIVSPYLWRKSYKSLNSIFTSILLVLPGVYLTGSTDSGHAGFQFYSSFICIVGCYWFVFKAKIIKYLK